MRIALDARPASHTQPGGFKRYTEQLLSALARVDRNNQYLVYYDRVPERDFFAGNPNFQATILETRLPSFGVMWREQYSVTRQAARDAADVLHFPANTCAWRVPCPAIVTLHDIIFWDERPDLQASALREKLKRYGMYLYGRWAARAAIQTARRLITVSEYAKRAIIERFEIAPQRVIVVHNGLAEKFRPLPEKDLQPIREKFGLRKSFILGITSASPRKNAPGLLAAYRALEPAIQEEFDLVLVWTHGLWKGQLQQLVETDGLATRVHFVETASDDDLVGLMNLATTFVFPSLEEGFGMPPLEAMACGTPVVASNRSSLPEILGAAALLIDPTNARALAEAIASILQNESLADDLSERGKKWAARYTWTQCAEKTIQVYQEASLAG